MKNIKLTIEYDGKEYNGWQKQPNKLNIQGEIERAIQNITGEQVELIGSGRTDKKDAANIARCLAFHTYSEVYVPDNDDNDVKEYIRMRDDQKLYLKKVKQQILAFVLRQGKHFECGKTYWTIAHLKWLKTLELSALQRETLDEYLLAYEYLTEKISRFDDLHQQKGTKKK